jgi:hypothetical protein
MQLDPAIGNAMVEATRKYARRGPWMQLLSALMALAEGKAELVRHAERAWASVTFSGSRHSITLAFTGAEAVAAGEDFIEALPDHEFTIPRQLVADVVVLALDQVLLPEPRLEIAIEVLLLEDS